MDKLNMQTIYDEFGVESQEQKNLLNELVFLVISGNSRYSGYTDDKKDNVRKALYGESFGSLQEKVFGVAGYWSNDLEAILVEDLGLSGDDTEVFARLFELLDDKEIIEGVCYTDVK